MYMNHDPGLVVALIACGMVRVGYLESGGGSSNARAIESAVIVGLLLCFGGCMMMMLTPAFAVFIFFGAELIGVAVGLSTAPERIANHDELETGDCQCDDSSGSPTA